VRQRGHVRIRPAVTDDLEALVALENASFQGDRLSRRSLRRFLRKGGDGVVLADDGAGRVLGSAIVLRRRRSTRERLYSLAVDPTARGHGLGRMLLDHLLAQARARGARAMRLEVREDNASALGLYREAGFREYGRLPGYYADGTAAVRMDCPLEGAG
jgi:[ribosomal protein S18]-alanine N-acetyltransferase